MLLLKCPPSQHSKMFSIRWFGASIILHGLLLVCAMSVASMFSYYTPAHSGRVMTVSIVSVGSTAAGESSALVPDSQLGTLLAQQSETEQATVIKKVSPKRESEVKAAVPIKRQDHKKVAVAKEAAQQAEMFTEHSAAPLQDTPRQSTGTASDVQGNSGNSVANNGAGTAMRASGIVNGEGSPQPQTVVWNAAGGPGFNRQGPLHYPRAAQRRNLEGKAIVEAYLDMQGKLVRARVLQADHEDFGDAALACIRASSFKPAQRDGKAVPCVVRIPMLFVLKGM